MAAILWFGLALAVGAGIMFQAGINSQLSATVGSPVSAAFISFTAGTIVLGLLALVLRVPIPAWPRTGGEPLYIWVAGGVLGAAFVATTILLVPRLGASAMIAGVIAGQMISALLLDQWGLAGYHQQDITLWRGIGAALLVVGAILVQKF
ncbi:MAG: DMT family transporter [Proteobacteria bacterium]|nr:DMT family transporter [Pseudomonadota bacterium]